jgi:hypothetical protein
MRVEAGTGPTVQSQSYVTVPRNISYQDKNAQSITSTCIAGEK